MKKCINSSCKRESNKKIAGSALAQKEIIKPKHGYRENKDDWGIVEMRNCSSHSSQKYNKEKKQP